MDKSLDEKPRALFLPLTDVGPSEKILLLIEEETCGLGNETAEAGREEEHLPIGAGRRDGPTCHIYRSCGL
jgi:hypothetical protein